MTSSQERVSHHQDGSSPLVQGTLLAVRSVSQARRFHLGAAMLHLEQFSSRHSAAYPLPARVYRNPPGPRSGFLLRQLRARPHGVQTTRHCRNCSAVSAQAPTIKTVSSGRMEPLRAGGRTHLVRSPPPLWHFHPVGAPAKVTRVP